MLSQGMSKLKLHDTRDKVKRTMISRVLRDCDGAILMVRVVVIRRVPSRNLWTALVRDHQGSTFHSGYPIVYTEMYRESGFIRISHREAAPLF